jgi:hypothetical protein
MPGEAPSSKLEKLPSVRALDSLRELLEGAKFPPKPGRTMTRKVEVPSDSFTYHISHTKFERDFNYVSSYTVLVKDLRTEEDLRFYLSEDDRKLLVNGETAGTDDDWERLETVLSDVRTAQEQMGEVG